MRELFTEKRFNIEAEALIGRCNIILSAYQEQGYDLSLRQLYYQLVASNVIPNEERSYKRLGEIISDARLAGLVDWDMIKDRGRETIISPRWKSPADLVEAGAEQFRIEKWKDQDCYVEVMVEKQALEGVLIPVCHELDVAFTANKGYSSSSALYEAGKRILDRSDEGKEVHLIYLGDHDPSGIDMSRDVWERLELFSGTPIEFHRVALNMDQIRRLRPPENPAKLTDSRAAGYIKRFGRSSWELDALEPRLLAEIVRGAVLNLRDDDRWAAAVEREEEMKLTLRNHAAMIRDQEERS